MSDIVMSLMSVMFSSMAKRIYLMSSGHQYLLTGAHSLTPLGHLKSPNMLQ